MSNDNKKNLGSLTRANQLVVGDTRGHSSVFTISHWTNASVRPLGEPAHSRVAGPNRYLRRPLRDSTAPAPDVNLRARLVLLKLQESVLNFLIRWFLLEESDRATRHQEARGHGKYELRPTTRTSYLRSALSQLSSSSYGRKRAAITSTSADDDNSRGARSGVSSTRSSLLLKDVARLQNRDWRTVMKLIFWRWFTWTNVVELVLILLLLACCTYQCYELLEDYFTYPTHVTVSSVFNDDFRADLPAVTICNNNRISLETMKREYPELNESHFMAMTLGTFYSVNNFSLSPPAHPNGGRGPHSSSGGGSGGGGGDDWMTYGDEITTVKQHQQRQQQQQQQHRQHMQTSDQQRQHANISEIMSSMNSSSIMVMKGQPRDNMTQGINWIRVVRHLSKNRPSGYWSTMPTYDIIETLLCANVWGEQMPCQNLRRLYTLQQAAFCFTLFHESVFWDHRDPAVRDLEEAIQKRPSTIKFGNQVTGGELLEINEAEEKLIEEEDETERDENLIQVDMANMEMIRIRLNFQRHDYANKQGIVGGRIAVHSNSAVGEVSHKSYLLKPGFWYNYYVDRFDYQRLPPPYSTQCYDYDASRYVWLDRSKWLASIRRRVQALIKEQAGSPNKLVSKYVDVLRYRSMGKHECMKICKLELSSTFCGCYAWGEIYSLNMTLDYDRTYEWCQLDNLAERMANKTGERHPAGDDLFFQVCAKRYSDLCASACPDECFYSNFDVIQQARSWPSHEAQRYMQRNGPWERLRREADCCATISVIYSSPVSTFHMTEPKYSRQDMVTIISGNIEAWLGLSAVHVYLFVEHFYDAMVEARLVRPTMLSAGRLAANLLPFGLWRRRQNSWRQQRQQQRRRRHR